MTYDIVAARVRAHELNIALKLALQSAPAKGGGQVAEDISRALDLLDGLAIALGRAKKAELAKDAYEAGNGGPPPRDGAEKIMAERRRHVLKGWSEEHDDKWTKGELALAAALYATPRPLYGFDGVVGQTGGHMTFKDPWPWEKSDDKRTFHDQRERLVIAGALLSAEIDRIDRVVARACIGFGGESRGDPCCSFAGKYGSSPDERRAIHEACYGKRKNLCACHD